MKAQKKIFPDRAIMAKFRIEGDHYSIVEIEDLENEWSYGQFYRVFKNGMIFETANGSDFETETEAEINILNEYNVNKKGN